MQCVLIKSPNGENEFAANISKLNSLEKKLICEKNHLDEIYKDKQAYKTMKLFDPLHKEKFNIMTKYGIYNITNAWMKCYEMLHYFKLLDHVNETCIYFDNAAFPGSFVLATHQYASNIKNFKWHASSLIEITDENKSPLDDTYNLYKNYPDNWLMNNRNNGDITNMNNIRDFAVQFKEIYNVENPVNLYTCDLGFDASHDYNNQEKMHSIANLGQIVCGLTILAEKGNMIIKHYTLFNQFTRSYIALLTSMFEEVYAVKPMSSKRTNSETYIICKCYTITNIKANKSYKLFVERMVNHDITPLLDENMMAETTESILKFSSIVYNTQIRALASFRKIYNKKKNKNSCVKHNRHVIKTFNKIPIKSCIQLNVKNIYPKLTLNRPHDKSLQAS